MKHPQMKDAKFINMVDELQTAVREIFTEHGYDVDVSLAVEDGASLGFTMDPKGDTSITQEIVDDIVAKGLERIGASHIDFENSEEDFEVDNFGDDFDE